MQIDSFSEDQLPEVAFCWSSFVLMTDFAKNMDRFLKDHSQMLIFLGAGLAIGTSGTVIYYKVSKNRSISRQVAQLAIKIERLCQDVRSLKATIENATQARRTKKGYYSVHASSGEDDDDFEEAVDDMNFR